MKEKLFLSPDKMPENVMGKEVFPGMYTTNPHLPIYMFVPIVIAMFYLSIFHFELSLKEIFLGGTVALLFWPVFEYFMHRFLFHLEPTSPFWKKAIYTIHQGHHDYPNDQRLMLVGPVVSIPAFFILWGGLYLLAGHFAHPFMGTFAACYMCYDWLHYATHNYNFDNKLFQLLKVHHMRHHYEDNDKNFAFTTLIWDIIMKTLLK